MYDLIKSSNCMDSNHGRNVMKLNSLESAGLGDHRLIFTIHDHSFTPLKIRGKIPTTYTSAHFGYI